MTNFTELGIEPFLAERLSKRGIHTPTAIQSLVIKRLLSGESVLFESATGTGKTFAYLLPLLQLLQLLKRLRAEGAETSPLPPVALIRSPSGVLAVQIKRETDFLLEGFSARGIRSSLIVGQANIDHQIDALKKDKPALIIGNSGRLLQLLDKKKLNLKTIRFLVMDEADRLVSDELLQTTTALLRAACPARLNAACSATISAKSRERLRPFLGDFFEEASAEQEILREHISHWAIWSEERDYADTLRSFLAAARPKKALVFLAQGDKAQMMVNKLRFHKQNAAALYSGMDKAERKSALADFISGKARVLVTTDLASRGLDISGISHVVSIGLNQDAEVYIHRAGRTARAGNRGIMVSIGDEKSMRALQSLEKKLALVVYPKILSHGQVCPAE
jgi:superfamily II DNA/RNA helicase